MLRDRLGAPRFDAGLREFWRAHRFERAGWSDLQRSFEAASGENLEAFFRQWLERTGAPQIRVEDARAERNGTGHRVHVTLAQGAEPYSIAVPLALDTDTGSEVRVVHLHQQRQTFVLESASMPRALRLDPQLRVFRRLDARELPPILRQVMLDPASRVQLELEAGQRETGLALARALLDHAPVVEAANARAPRLIIGTHDAVDRALARARLPARPSSLVGRGSAQVWTAYADGGRAIAVVSARDAAALQALTRPLPHYGRQSWLVFEGAKAVDRGVWPGEPIEITLTSD
jgi:hypothetical protein